MALRLNDIQNKNKAKKKAIALNFDTEKIEEKVIKEEQTPLEEKQEFHSLNFDTPEVSQEDFGPKKIRPWESYQDEENKTRTHQANLAVRRARKIVEENEKLARSLRESMVSRVSESEEDFNTKLYNPNIAYTPYRPKTPKFFQRIKDLFDY